MSPQEPTTVMSTSANSMGPSENREQTRWTGKQWFLYVGCPTFVLALLIGGPLEQLLLGWVYFPLRVLPRVSVDWATAILGLISVSAFAYGLHATLIWFARNRSSGSVGVVNWSPRSSVVLALTMMLMFAAGTAMVGATHQFIWVITGRAARPGDEQAVAQRRFGLVTGALDVAREQARQTQEKNNLRQVGMAMNNTEEFNRCFPPGGTMDSSGQLMHGWAIFIAPYSFYTTYGIDYAVPWNRPPNDRMYQCALSEHINPSMPGPYFDQNRYGLSHVAGNVNVLPICRVNTGDQGLSHWEQVLRKSPQKISSSTITDGTSNTLLIGTAADQFKPWGHPANLRDPALGINRHPNGFGGPKNWKGALTLMCDGSVRFVSNDIDPKVIRALGTPAGGEPIEAAVVGR